MEVKRRILVDLDVLTVALWDKKKESLDFLERIRKEEFDLYTPHILLEIIGKWKYDKLKDKITEFYTIYSSRILSVKEIVSRSEEIGANYNDIIRNLMSKGVKEEDAVLVFVASAFYLDYLVTYNRVHLKNKESVINDVLKSHKLKVIKIVSPDFI